MATNVLQKNQSYPELGYRIDGKGIAYDLKTNQSLSRQDVDSRIATLEDADPTNDDYAARDRQRGGVAGVWDRNKKPLTIAAALAAGAISGGTLAPALLGAAMKGFDREGKGGIGLDAKQAIKGGIEGYALGGVGKALGAAGSAAKGAGGLLSGTGAKAAGASLLGLPAKSASGDPASWGDLAKGAVGQLGTSIANKVSGGLPSLGSLGGAIGGALGGGGGGGGGSAGTPAWMGALAAAQGVNAAALGAKSGDYAQKAWDTQNDLWKQKADLRSQGIAGMTAAPTKMPALAPMAQSANPFATKG